MPESKNQLEQSTSISGITISSKGYLKFKTSEAAIKFGKLLNSSEKNKLLDELKNKGFINRHCVMANNYSRNGNSIYDLIFDENGLLQVDDVILKITDDDKFIFTLKEELADTATFHKLLNEVYDGMRMNKLNVNRDFGEAFDLIDFTAENPFGQWEQLNNASRLCPMFGGGTSPRSYPNPAHSTLSGGCEVCTDNYETPYTIIFWITFYGTEVYIGTTCSAVDPSQCGNSIPHGPPQD